MYHGIQNYDPSSPRLHLEMEAGDTVFFHPLLIHGSGMNRTEGFRKVNPMTTTPHPHHTHSHPTSLVHPLQAISCHYAASECEYISVEGTSQEMIEEEVVELARKRLGHDAVITFQARRFELKEFVVTCSNVSILLSQDTWRIRGVSVKGDRKNL